MSSVMHTLVCHTVTIVTTGATADKVLVPSASSVLLSIIPLELGPVCTSVGAEMCRGLSEYDPIVLLSTTFTVITEEEKGFFLFSLYLLSL